MDEKSQNIDANQDEIKNDTNKYIFWRINENGSVKILPSKVYELLQVNGVAKYYPDEKRKDTKPIYVLIRDKIIEPVGKDFMVTLCKRFIDYTNPPEEMKNSIIDALHRSMSIFSESNQYLLITAKIDIVRDTSDKSYFFFRNSAVKVTADNIAMVPYIKLDGYVWKSNIIDSDIKLLDSQIVIKDSVFMHFLSDITRKADDPKANALRIGHLFSLIGYLLHRHKNQSNARAVIIMDENPTFSADGGTGKSLIFKAIGKVRLVIVEDGRNFDPGGRFAFQHVNESADIFLIDDAAANFNFAKIFPFITEDFPVEVKFKTRRVIPFLDAPKIAITTNYSIKGIGGSYSRRKYEYEISAHYGDGYSPETKYKQIFFQDWDETQWNLFYNTMLLAAKFYLENGIILSEPLNLKRTHLINSTCEEFADFADEHINLNQE